MPKLEKSRKNPPPNKPNPSKEVLPIKEYQALTHWKGLCTELLDSLRAIDKAPNLTFARRVAYNALQKFERDK